MDVSLLVLPQMVPIPTHPEAVHSGFIEATTAFQGTHVWADGFSTSLTGQGLPYKVEGLRI